MIFYQLIQRTIFTYAHFFKTKLNRRGQTLVEFILLMVVIISVSMLFMKMVNSNIAVYWKFIVTKVVADPSIRLDI